MREGGILEQDVDRPSGEPACLGALPDAPRLVAAANLLEKLLIELVAVDLPLVREAAEIKSEYAVSYADAFCIATARRLSGTVLTSDQEEAPSRA